MEHISNHEDVMNILLKEDDISWKSLIYELVRTEQMDPWDIDISLLSQKYIELVKKLHAFDFRLSGKILLAAAILLHIKSVRFLEFDITNLNNLINPPEALDEDESFYEQTCLKDLPSDRITLIPRTPQPRKRKVSVYDLIDALNKALEVRNRRILREVNVPEISVPEKKVDITKIIFDLHKQIKKMFETKDKIYFTDLIGGDTREDKVYTFVPLLHLTNQGKIDLEQEVHFEDIEIKLAKQEGKHG